MCRCSLLAKSRIIHLVTSPSGLRRKYSKFSYVLCRCRFLMRICGTTKHYKKIYHNTQLPCSFPNIRSVIWLPSQLLSFAFSFLVVYDNCLWSAKHNKQFQEIKLIIFVSRFSGKRTTALYESKYFTVPFLLRNLEAEKAFSERENWKFLW